MVDLGLCNVCKNETSQKCSNCLAVFYCSREHQKQDWKQHKGVCCPARVKSNEDVGRYLEAVRDIKAGDIIYKETPLITGPAQITPAICLGCHKQLVETRVVECDKCGWPFCSSECTQEPTHKPECYYTTTSRKEKVKINAFGVVHPNYQCLTVLRCLYQRDHDKDTWEKLMALESHCKQRKSTEKWQNDRSMIVQFLWKFFKLEGIFTEDEIMKCCGIIQVNGHEVPLMEPGYVAVYERMSLLEHNCRANCCKSFSNNGQLILSAGVDIKTGSHLSVCYTDPLWGTEARRYYLAETKFFECQCERCSDPTEFGTFYNAVKCQKKNCKGSLLPDSFLVPILSKNENEQKGTTPESVKRWKCSICKDLVADNIIQKLLEDIGQELNLMPKGKVDACERFIDHCSKYLHPNHFYMTDVAMALAQLIGQQSESAAGLADESDDHLLLKTHLCQKLADLFEVLIPAENRARGCILFELHAAIAETGRRKSLAEGPAAMLGYIIESRKILGKAATLLKHEPEVLPEGKIGVQANSNIKQLDKLIEKLTNCLSTPL